MRRSALPGAGMRVSSALLQVRDLSVSFGTEDGAVRAVRELGFDLAAGEVLAIVGESGAGKSAAAQAIVGLNSGASTRVAGSAMLAGQELLGAPEEELRLVRGARIAMVFQDPMTSFNPVHRVGSQLVEAIRAHRRGLGRARAREMAVEMLDTVGIPEPERRVDSFPHELSGGMRQRAMIAMALLLEPEVLIADEPTSALDVTVQARVLALLARLNRERNLATVLITHDLGIVAEIADRVLVMRDGWVVERGDVRTVFRSPRDPYTRRLLESVVGLEGAQPPRPGRGTEPLLQVSDLSKRFPARRGLLFDRGGDSVRAVEGVSFAVERGETLGLVGESGSGKSTLCRAVLQLLAPSGGSVRFRGQEIAGLSRRRMRPLRAEMQMIFQDPYSSLNPRRRAGEIVADPIRELGDASGRELRVRAGELLERVGLRADHYHRYPSEFSGGERQRIGIARALATRPKLILADEPVSALDASIRAQIVALMQDLQRELDLAYVFVAHDIGLVRHVSDRIAVMREGQIVEQGPADRVCERPEHPYTRELLEAVPVPDPERRRW